MMELLLRRGSKAQTQPGCKARKRSTSPASRGVGPRRTLRTSVPPRIGRVWWVSV